MALMAWDQDLWAPFFGDRAFGNGNLVNRMGETARALPMDVKETKEAFEIAADCPGVDKKDIKLSVNGDVLSLNIQQQTSKEDKKEESGVKWHRTERSSQFVSRSLRLPEVADFSKIKARSDNGVLHITVPKSEEKTKVKNVAIE